MAEFKTIGGKLFIDGKEIIFKEDTVSKTQIVDFGTVVNNTRTVLPNPFFDGVNDADIAVACTARAEILAGGKWCGTKINASTSATWNGAEASTVAEGIVLQTALSTLNSNNTNRTGVAYGGQVTSAPCRVIVTYHGDLILPSSAIVKPEYIDSRSLATAWVICKGDGTILASYNVSSVSFFNSSEMSVTFETPMDNANYTSDCFAKTVNEYMKGGVAADTVATAYYNSSVNYSATAIYTAIFFGGKNS